MSALAPGKNKYMRPSLKKERLKINFFTRSKSVTSSLVDNSLESSLTAYCHYDCSWMKC